MKDISLSQNLARFKTCFGDCILNKVSGKCIDNPGIGHICMCAIFQNKIMIGCTAPPVFVPLLPYPSAFWAERGKLARRQEWQNISRKLCSPNHNNWLKIVGVLLRLLNFLPESESTYSSSESGSPESTVSESGTPSSESGYTEYSSSESGYTEYNSSESGPTDSYYGSYYDENDEELAKTKTHRQRL